MSIKNISNSKSRTKISKINPSDRLISQKTLFKARFMKPLHAHGAPQPILGFISIDLFFHAVSTSALKLREGMEMMVQVPASFLEAYFWVQ